MHYSPPGSFVYGTLQSRILEWVAVHFSRESSQSRNQISVSWVSYITGEFITAEPSGKPIILTVTVYYGKVAQIQWKRLIGKGMGGLHMQDLHCPQDVLILPSQCTCGLFLEIFIRDSLHRHDWLIDCLCGWTQFLVPSSCPKRSADTTWSDGLIISCLSSINYQV